MPQKKCRTIFRKNIEPPTHAQINTTKTVVGDSIQTSNKNIELLSMLLGALLAVLTFSE